MPLRFALACTLALSSGLSANTINDIDTQSVDWLLSQISIGEAQQNKKLVEDSLRKLVAIAPARIETQCAVARYDFANGEIFVRFEESVRGCDAFVIQSHTTPVNKQIMEQLIMVDALKRASAKRITVVAPFNKGP